VVLAKRHRNHLVLDRLVEPVPARGSWSQQLARRGMGHSLDSFEFGSKPSLIPDQFSQNTPKWGVFILTAL